MKQKSHLKISHFLSLAGLLPIYFLLCSQFILKQVSNTEAANYLGFSQVPTSGQALVSPHHNFFPQNIYFSSLSFWTQILALPSSHFALFQSFVVHLLFSSSFLSLKINWIQKTHSPLFQLVF